MQYIFLKDFPPTKWKKGDVIDSEKGVWPDSLFYIGFMLSLGVIEEHGTEWKPKENEPYYFIDGEMEISCEDYSSNNTIDPKRINGNNFFKTRELALEAAELIKKVLKEYKQK